MYNPFKKTDTEAESHFEDALEDFLKNAVTRAGGQRGLILRCLPNSQQMEVKATVGGDLQKATAWDQGAISQTVIQVVASDRKPLLTNSAAKDPRFEDRTSVMVSGLRSVLAVPIFIDEQVWGVLYIDNPALEGVFKKPQLEELIVSSNELSEVIKLKLKGFVLPPRSS